MLKRFETEFEAEIYYCYDKLFIVINEVLKGIVK